MPGAPNRPPPTDPASAPAAPVAAEAGRAVLRRLAPARVALNLDQWKGSPSADLLAPFDRAEAAFSQGDFPNAVSALDQLAVRFAEPRWPTLPEPFRGLRVSIPAPQPPQWDPDHALSPAEKDAKKLRRDADLQVALAAASLGWMASHGLPTTDLESEVARARELLGSEGLSNGFWEALDRAWTGVRARVPLPVPKGRPAAPSAAPSP